MIIVEKARNENGILLKGDFFDLDRLYFAINKFTGYHGLDNECTFPGYEQVCENLLGLCYEIRHAWQGDRNIDLLYNGIKREWFSDYAESDTLEKNDENDTDEEDSDIENHYPDNTANFRFSRKDFPNVTNSNTYFSIPIAFPEAVFYALILVELLQKKEIFLQKRKLLSEKNDPLMKLNKEYYYFHAHEDIARLTLFSNHVLHALYKFIGEEKYIAFMDKFTEKNNFFLHCNLDKVNKIVSDYAEQEHENDSPEHIFSVLTSFFICC